MAKRKTTIKKIVEKKDEHISNVADLFLEKKHVFLILFAMLIFFGYTILKPYFVVIIMSMVLSYVIYPIFKYLNKSINNRNVSSAITLLIFIVIIFIPISMVGSMFYVEVIDSINYIKANKENINDLFSCISYENIDLSKNTLCNKLKEYKSNLSVINFDDAILSNVNKFGDFVGKRIYSLLKGITSKIIEIVMMLFTIFFLTRDGEKLIKKTKNILSLKQGHEKKIFRDLNNTTFAVVYGILVVALIQGIIGGIGAYFIAGISSAILIGALITFASLMPFLGSSLIWAPISIFLFINGIITGDHELVIRGIGFFLYGALIVGLIDNILRPKIIGDKAKIHPLLIFFGIFGGLQLFGFFGIIIGPIVLSLLVTFIKIYETELLNK